MGEIETRLAIGGERVAGDGGPIGVEDPYTEENGCDRQRAVGRAGRGRDRRRDRGAARLGAPPGGRARGALHHVATRLRARTDELAELMPLEGGKPLLENSDEIGWTGRKLGREGLEAFQETKHVHIETEIEEKDWWYPYGD